MSSTLPFSSLGSSAHTVRDRSFHSKAVLRAFSFRSTITLPWNNRLFGPHVAEYKIYDYTQPDRWHIVIDDEVEPQLFCNGHISVVHKGAQLINQRNPS